MKTPDETENDRHATTTCTRRCCTFTVSRKNLLTGDHIATLGAKVCCSTSRGAVARIRRDRRWSRTGGRMQRPAAKSTARVGRSRNIVARQTSDGLAKPENLKMSVAPKKSVQGELTKRALDGAAGPDAQGHACERRRRCLPKAVARAASGWACHRRGWARTTALGSRPSPATARRRGGFVAGDRWPGCTLWYADAAARPSCRTVARGRRHVPVRRRGPAMATGRTTGGQTAGRASTPPTIGGRPRRRGRLARHEEGTATASATPTAAWALARGRAQDARCWPLHL